MTSYDEVIAKLGIDNNAKNILTGWDAGQSCMPSGNIDFLTEADLLENCKQVFLPDNITRAILKTAGKIRNNDALRAFAWYCHYMLFRSGHKRELAAGWPLLSGILGQEAGLFNVVTLLSGTPKLRELFKNRKIPPEIFRDTVLYLKWYVEEGDYYKDFGYWGLTPRALAWVANYWQGNVFRLRRLTFAFGACEARLRVFLNRSDGTVIALSEPDITYRSDGQINGSGGVTDETGAWTSSLEITDKQIRGNLIDPESYTVHDQTSIRRDEWKAILKPGDPIIEIHIAAGAPMTHEACGASLRQAQAFFKKHFPEKPFKAFTCFSWILDAQFEKLLLESSNLVRFQKDVYLFPIKGDNQPTLQAVFGIKTDNIADAPRNTSMQKALAGHIERGGHFRCGGCFLLPEDIHHWSEQFYRNQSFFRSV